MARPFSQHFSEAIGPEGDSSLLLAATAAASWLRHLPDADASVQALAAALGSTPEAVRERLQASLNVYVADHWSDLEAIGVSNLEGTPTASPDARRSGASPAAASTRPAAQRLQLAVHRVQEGIVADRFRVQALERSLLYADKQLSRRSEGDLSSPPPSLASAARDAWRWSWSCFPPPLRRCMPRLEPLAQLALSSAPARRPRIVMLTGGMGAGKSTAIARLLQLEQFVVIEADQFKARSAPALDDLL